MDNTDKKLLALLQANAREPTSSIARKLGVSRSTVQSRIERLENRRIVGGYTVRLNEDYASSRIRAHVLITVAPKLAPRVDAELQKIPEVTSLYSISGANDLIAILASWGPCPACSTARPSHSPGRRRWRSGRDS